MSEFKRLTEEDLDMLEEDGFDISVSSHLRAAYAEIDRLEEICDDEEQTITQLQERMDEIKKMNSKTWDKYREIEGELDKKEAEIDRLNGFIEGLQAGNELLKAENKRLNKIISDNGRTMKSLVSEIDELSEDLYAEDELNRAKEME